MLLSVVVVSYNVREELRACLRSLVANPHHHVVGSVELPPSRSPSRREGAVLSPSPPPPRKGDPREGDLDPLPIEIVVVDNDSGDGSAAMVRQEFPDVALVAAGRNLGFAAATNLGLQRCRGDLLLLLNPDTEVVGRALVDLARFLVDHPAVAAAGPRLVYPDGTPQDACFAFPTLPMVFLDFFPVHWRLLRSRLNGRYPPRDVPFPVGHPLGACMMVRREALKDVGLLDEGFFMYCEEVDWCLRAWKKGWQVYHVPSAVVVHHGGRSARQFRHAMFVALHASRWRLYHKHYTPAFRTVARLLSHLYFWWDERRTARQARLGLVAPDEVAARRAAYADLRRLLASRPDEGPPRTDVPGARPLASPSAEPHAPSVRWSAPDAKRLDALRDSATAVTADVVTGAASERRARETVSLSPLPRFATAPAPSSSEPTPTVGVVVIARDEERHIAACLQSATWADDLLVVLDDRTRDRTAELAQQHGARVVRRSFSDFARFRNEALALATTDWVFFLDADEQITPELAAEIRATTTRSGPGLPNGYWVPRRNLMFGRHVRHAGWSPDFQLRLLKRNAARYDEDRPVHEIVVLDGAAGYLSSPLVHHNYDTLAEFCAKQRVYTRMEAVSLHRQGVRARRRSVMGWGLREFWRRYVTLQGYRDGLLGLVLSLLMGYYAAYRAVEVRRLGP